LKEAQPAAEGAAPHLIDYVEQTTLSLWKQMKGELESSLQNVLKQMKWPGKDLNAPEDLIAEWSKSVERLLDLQEPYAWTVSGLETMVNPPNSELKSLNINGKASVNESVVLLPLEIMARPLALRFKYHFSGDKPTNRLDKVRYYPSADFDPK
jgi:hypothetical protein